jgi:hypothetical protein
MSIFHNLGGGGGCCGTNWPIEEVGIATLLEYDENDRFLTASCGPYLSHTLRFFLHIPPKKKTHRVAFENNA